MAKIIDYGEDTEKFYKYALAEYRNKFGETPLVAVGRGSFDDIAIDLLEAIGKNEKLTIDNTDETSKL